MTSRVLSCEEGVGSSYILGNIKSLGFVYITDMRTTEVSKCNNFRTKRFQLKSRISMAFQPSADSFGIRRLGFKCSWWHRRQANDAVAFEQSIF